MKSQAKGAQVTHKDRGRPTPDVRSGFIRAVGHAVRGYRLGDLLVASHLITAAQLEKALARQSDTREPLGKILVCQGAISTVQLYRKLAEQWCLKASAAGLALLVETTIPATAHAEDMGEQNIRLASAFSPAAIRPAGDAARPNLFGSREIKSNNISAFTKWKDVISRFEGQMARGKDSDARVQAWQSHLQQLKSGSTRAKIDGVNNYINATRYIEDSANYGKSDYWATPVEFLSKGGDCEDYAVAKYASLRALGFSTDQLRIAIVQDKIKNIPHALLIVYTEEGTFVLDNQSQRVESAENVTRYKPVFSINSQNWWLHRVTAGA